MAGYEFLEAPDELIEHKGAAEIPQPVEPAAGGTGESGESLGYSSDYYKHQMESALASGNKIAYENAKRDYAKAAVRESLGTGEASGETPQEGSGESGEDHGEALGYSSEYYKHQMASDLSSGNKIAYKNHMNAYSRAVVRESLGSGEVPAAEVPEAPDEAAETETGESLGTGHLHHEMMESIKAKEMGDEAASKRLFKAAQLRPESSRAMMEEKKEAREKKGE